MNTRGGLNMPFIELSSKRMCTNDARYM